MRPTATCGSCGRNIQYPGEYEGRTARCPACKNPVPLGPAGQEARHASSARIKIVADPDEPKMASSGRMRRIRGSRDSMRKLIVACAAGFVGLGALVALLVLLASNSSAEKQADWLKAHFQRMLFRALDDVARERLDSIAWCKKELRAVSARIAVLHETAAEGLSKTIEELESQWKVASRLAGDRVAPVRRNAEKQSGGNPGEKKPAKTEKANQEKAASGETVAALMTRRFTESLRSHLQGIDRVLKRSSSFSIPVAGSRIGGWHGKTHSRSGPARLRGSSLLVVEYQTEAKRNRQQFLDWYRRRSGRLREEILARH